MMVADLPTVTTPADGLHVPTSPLVRDRPQRLAPPWCSRDDRPRAGHRHLQRPDRHQRRRRPGHDLHAVVEHSSMSRCSRRPHTRCTPLGPCHPGSWSRPAASPSPTASGRAITAAPRVHDPRRRDHFWAINQYYRPGHQHDIWNTWVASFQVDSDHRDGLLLGQCQRRRQPPLRHLDAGRRTPTSSSTTSTPSCCSTIRTAISSPSPRAMPPMGGTR